MDSAERRTAGLLSRPATLRALLEGAAEAFMAVDRNGRIVLVNRATQAMFGYTRRDLIGKPFARVLPESVRERYSAEWPSCFAALGSREPGSVYEAAGRRKDGTEFPIEVRLSIIETEAGPLAFSFVADTSARRQAEAALNESREQLRALAGRLISAEEESRKQLARDLHDVLSQRLALLSMEVSALEQEARRSAPELRDGLKSLGDGVVRLASDVQRISRQLHPSILADLGLAAALESECCAISHLHGTPAKLARANLPRSLPEDVSVALYRIGQEALRNAAKHAQASEIFVSLDSTDGDVVLKVQDNGRGFDPAVPRKAGLGLVSIQERARLVNGSVKLESSPGRGTSLEVRVPLPKGNNEAATGSR